MFGTAGGATAQPSQATGTPSMVGEVPRRNAAPGLTRNKRDCVKTVCANSNAGG